jgi:hypothetical protein
MRPIFEPPQGVGPFVRPLPDPKRSHMLDATPRPFSFGELLDGAFTLYRRNFVAFFGAALLPQVPIVLYWLSAPLWAPMDLASADMFDPTSLLIAPYNFFASFLVLGAVTYAVGAAYAGESPTIGESLRRGLSRWIPITLAAICAGFLVMLGLFLLIVPGLILIALFFAVAPLVVLEGRGPIEALSRSSRLSKGGRPRILGAMVVAWLITYLPVATVGILAATAAAITTLASGQGPEALLSSWVLGLFQALSPVVSSLTWPFFIAVTVLLYYDRRARSEAPDLEEAVERLQPGV